MNNLTEPSEIELCDFPWQAPLMEVEEACFAARRYHETVEPEDLSVIERKLFEASPSNFKWTKEKFEGLPSYLTKYFANRYASICEKKSSRDANIFLREKMAPASERVRMVLAKYKKLPTTQKVALLSEEHDDTEQSNFARSHQSKREQICFDFDKAERNRKPVKSRILAELEQDELREMAFKISMIMNSRYQYFSKQQGAIHNETRAAVLAGYELLAEFIIQFGVKAPRKYKMQTELSALQDISRMISEKWWLGRLVKLRKIMREHLAIAMGQVSSKASAYCSWDCIREHQDKQKANYEYIKQHQLIDEETGEKADLWDMVKKSVANPAIRRHELMVRCRGCEDIGNELGLQGLFLTLTAPAKYHNSYKKGGFISHWNGASPRDAQAYLNNVWQRIRAKLGREEIRWFGVRVAEPHHDGTPHWHLLIWVKPDEVAAVEKVFIGYATQEDKRELFDRNGEFSHKARCDVGKIDPEKGSATGYIAKYISKNIDGFAMDDEVSDETGKPVKDMAKNVTAWKSRWNIRQFQFFGGAPVTTYRELRRFANLDKKAFTEYLMMQQRADLICLYDMLHYRTVGPIKPARILTNNELLEAIRNGYQPRIKCDEGNVAATMQAADNGNWQGYIMGQGGPFVKRDDLLIVNVYQELPFASPHGETVRKIEGFNASGMFVKTRTKVWTIQKIPKVNEDAEAGALASALDLAGSSAASRSSVNNCTEPDQVQVCDQLSRLFAPEDVLFKNAPNIDETALAALLKGSSLKVDNETSVHIRPAEVDEHGNKRPAQLVEVSRAPIDDMKWMEFESWDQVFAQPEQVKDEYQQPDLSFFPELESGDDGWPLI